MMHYYYFIVAGREIDETTRFYKVRIGSSKQAQRDFLYLTSYSVDNGHYFSLLTHESIDFVCKVQYSLHIKEIPWIYCDARDLVRAFKKDVQLIEESAAHKNADYQRRFLDTNYRILSNLRGAASPIRKAEPR